MRYTASMQASVYIPGTSLVHACHAGVKIILLIAYSVGIFFIDSWAGILLYGLVALGLAFLSGAPFKKYAMPLIPVYVLMFFTLLFNGLDPGVFFALRILFLALASLVVCFSTRPEALTGAFSAGLGPLRAVRVPVDDIATVLSLSLRFMPQMVVEVESLREAQVSRGAPFNSPHFRERLAAWGPVFVPLFVGLFRHADRLAQAMDARCYGMPGVRRTSLASGDVGAGSVVALIFGLVIFVGMALAL